MLFISMTLSTRISFITTSKYRYCITWLSMFTILSIDDMRECIYIFLNFLLRFIQILFSLSICMHRIKMIVKFIFNFRKTCHLVQSLTYNTIHHLYFFLFKSWYLLLYSIIILNLFFNLLR